MWGNLKLFTIFQVAVAIGGWRVVSLQSRLSKMILHIDVMHYKQEPKAHCSLLTCFQKEQVWSKLVLFYWRFGWENKSIKTTDYSPWNYYLISHVWHFYQKELIQERKCNYVKSSGKDHLQVVNVLLFILLIFSLGEGCGIVLQLTQIGL